MENVAVRFGSMTITEFFDDSQREFIISQYPANLRPHLERVRNPLDINEILTAMVSSWHVKMVLKAVEDDYEVYFHARDIARSLEYGEHGVNKWRPWLVEMGFDFIREEEIKGVSDSDTPLIFIGDFTGGRQPSTQYLIADALRVVLTKINKPKAKEWAGVLNGMATAIRRLMISSLRVKAMLDHDRSQQAISLLECRLSSAEEKYKREYQQKLERASHSTAMLPDAVREEGFIYIAADLLNPRSMTRKIGRTGDIHIRDGGYHTASPSTSIIWSRRVLDMKLTEECIFLILDKRRVWHRCEWVFDVDDRSLQSLVTGICMSVDTAVMASDATHVSIRSKYIEGETDLPFKQEDIHKSPTERTRSKSPSRTALIRAEVEEKRKNGTFVRGDCKRIKEKYTSYPLGVEPSQ